MTFEKQVLARIKAEKLKPTSRSYFKMRESLTWILLAFSVTALGLGLGMIISGFTKEDISLLASLELSSFERLLISVPVFWIITSVALAFIAFINFRHTKHGYKVSGMSFAVVALCIAAPLGIVTYASNVTNFVEDAASQVSIYKAVTPINTTSWFDPERGLLSGSVRDRDSNERFNLRDRDHELWVVTGENIIIPENWGFSPGDRIRIIGKMTGPFEFTAFEIHPWKD